MRVFARLSTWLKSRSRCSLSRSRTRRGLALIVLRAVAVMLPCTLTVLTWVRQLLVSRHQLVVDLCLQGDWPGLALHPAESGILSTVFPFFQFLVGQLQTREAGPVDCSNGTGMLYGRLP